VSIRTQRVPAARLWLAGALAALAALGGATPAHAAQRPGRSVEAIVRLAPGATADQGAARVRALHGRVTGDLHIIHGLAARVPARELARLRRAPEIAGVDADAPVKPQGKATAAASWGTSNTLLATAYPSSVNAIQNWTDPLTGLARYTGAGVGVAVIDTGIAGTMPDFKNPNGVSRVVASVVTNPSATTANDTYGHGTHVAGILAGNGNGRDVRDKAYGKYLGVAPDANLISIKAGDEQGNATVLDVIYGLQFVVDHKADYNIRVVNLSLESTVAQSYLVDPLDAAVESAWLNGVVVVAAAGNRGSAADAVSYAPGNDPFVISVGAVDDKGTQGNSDDAFASWSSRGLTQDGFAKPDVSAPGAHIVSTLAPNSTFTTLCPSCIVDTNYIRAGGTSMAAPVVAGVAALALQAHPDWTPDVVKTALMRTSRPMANGIYEVNASGAITTGAGGQDVNAGLIPNPLVNPTTGAIDYTRSSWSRSSWSTAPSSLTAGFARSSWSCNCSKTSSGTIDPTRSSWSRSSWSTAWNL